MTEAAAVVAAVDRVLDRRYGTGTSLVRSAGPAVLTRFAYDLHVPILVGSSVVAMSGAGLDADPDAGGSTRRSRRRSGR